MSNERIKSLSDFLDKTRDIFEGVLIDDNWFIDESLRESAKNAWDEIKDRFKNLKSEVSKADDEDLSRAGLSGEQLSSKLNAMEYFCNKGLTSITFRIINIILGSLMSVCGLAESIKEFKDCLECCRKSTK